MASGASWNLILGGIFFLVVIFMFNTGRSSLANLFRKKRSTIIGSVNALPQEDKLTRILNRPVFLIIGIVSSILGIYAFTKEFIGPWQPAVKKEKSNPAQQIVLANDSAAKKKDTGSKTPKVPVSKHQKDPARFTGIQIYTDKNEREADVTCRVQTIMQTGHRPPPVIRGTFTIDKRPDAPIGNTQTLLYNISLQLTIYQSDGLTACNNWYAAEQISADDQKPWPVIKEQALTALTNRMKQQLTTLLAPCH